VYWDEDLDWIYENLDLVDLKGKDLGRSVKDVFMQKK